MTFKELVFTILSSKLYLGKMNRGDNDDNEDNDYVKVHKSGLKNLKFGFPKNYRCPQLVLWSNPLLVILEIFLN